MSWQAYVDTSLVGAGTVDKAAIFSAAGDSSWATSSGFQLEPAEVKAIVEAFNDKTEPKSLFGTGFHIGRQKYVTIKADDSSIYGKQGKEGIIIVKTKQAILIAHHPETIQSGQAANTVEGLGEYLKGVGY